MRLITLIFSLVIMTSLLANAKEEYSKEWVKDEISRLQGASNVGSNFWLSVPPAYLQSINPNDFIKLFIVCPVETNVSITSPDGYVKNVQTVANGVVEVNLTPGEAQPFVFTYGQPGQESKVVEGRGLNIQADDPIVLYCVVRYYATSDGFLCIPTPALGTEYVATPYSSRPISETSLPNMVTVTAPYEDTQVKLTVGGNALTVIPVDGGPDLYPGDEYSWNLDQGDVLVLTNIGNNQTLSGSLIESNKPIAVISGHYCADIPVGNTACDYNVEMDLPAHVWGQHYHIPLVKNRRYPSILRIFAKEDNTKIYRDGREIGVIDEGMGGFENVGWWETRVWPYLPGNGKIALISGDKPIYVMLYNPGVSEDGGGSNSDPFSMLITPIEQYQTEITFATPGVSGGSPFAENYLNVVYQADENGLAPEDLLWGTDPTINGYVYQSMRDLGGTPDNYFDLGSSVDQWMQESPFAENQYQHLSLELPGIGIYNVRSPFPFAVYSYGYAFYDSYGFPTASAFKNLEIDDPFPPTADWEFGCETEYVLTGKITEQPVEEKNRISGIYSVNTILNENFDKIRVYDATFDDGVLLTQLFESKVIDRTLPGELIWLVTDGAGNSATFRETYFPEEYDFYAEVGEPGDKYFELYNDGVPYPEGITDSEFFIIENTSANGELVIEDILMKNRNQGQNFEFLPNSFEIDGVLMDPQPAIPLEAAITLDVGSMLRFGVEFTSVDDGRTRNIDELGIETCTYDIVYSVDIEARKGGPRINTVDPNPFAFTQIDASAQQQVEKGPLTYKIRNSCTDGPGTTDLVIVGIQGPADPQFRTDIEAQLEITIPAGGDREFNVWFQSDGTAGDFADQITFITEPAGLEDCRNFINLEASAGSTSLDAQAYNFDQIDLYEFVQAGQQGVMADDSQADDAPITVLNQATDDELVVDLNGGDVTLNNPDSDNKFFFDPAGTNAVDIDQNFDTEFLIANLQAGNKTATKNIYFKPNTTGNFGITYKVTGDTEAGVELETPEYQITGSAIVANLAIYKDADNLDASLIDFGTDVYPSALPVQTFEITNRRTDGDYTYGNTAVYTLTLSNNIGYGDANDVYIIENVEYADGRPYNGANLDQADLTLNAGETLIVTVRHNGEYNNGDVVNATIEIEDEDHNTLGDGTDLPNTGPWNDVINFQSQVTNITSFAGAAEFPETCVGITTLPINGEFFVENNSNNPFNITGMPTFNAVDGNNGGFTLEIVNVAKVDAAGIRNDLGLIFNTNPTLTLDPDERVVFDVEFTPNVDFGTKPMEVTYFTDIDDVNGVNTAPDVQQFELQTNSLEKNVLLRNVSGNDNPKIGDPLQVAIALQGGDNIAPANVTELQGSISYRRGYLVADYNSLALAPQYAADFELIPNDITDQFIPRGTTGKDDWIRSINFTIRSTNGTPVNANGDIVTMDFNVVVAALSLAELPKGKDETNIYIAQGREDDFTVNISAFLSPTTETSCASLNQPEDLPIVLDEECAYEFRTIATTGNFNTDSRVSQNPVTSTGADLEFSLALDGDTTIKLYDTNGNEVAQILNKHLSSGEHKIEIPVSNLPNGVYLYEINSQFYSSSNKFIISK